MATAGPAKNRAGPARVCQGFALDAIALAQQDGGGEFRLETQAAIRERAQRNSVPCLSEAFRYFIEQGLRRDVPKRVLREAARACRVGQRESRGVILERRPPSHRPRLDRNQADDAKAEVNI